uniref:Pea phy phytochrome apoprotein n=1 Tax=Pisum sativum TaxID=3888 RepID=Q5NV54_PEA|nr:hypothetical protein 2 - garden pea [Pisum sativum]CAA32241.1 unnamed protein product [Pisum sativum]
MVCWSPTNGYFNPYL